MSDEARSILVGTAGLAIAALAAAAMTLARGDVTASGVQLRAAAREYL